MAIAEEQLDVASEIGERQPVPAEGGPRPRAAGKFVFVGKQKLWIKGVTYGTFAPAEDGSQFPAPETVEVDFAAMAANGFNTIRTYTLPPSWILDTALRHGLRVMVGIPWEQHVAFLDDSVTRKRIEQRVRDCVAASAGHGAVLCYTLGNEIPPSIVRWHGRRRIEKFLKRLYDIAKAEDPEALLTYVNFPTTEYLRLPFLDLVCFNVYLESEQELSAYLARLQNLAGEKPLVMAEIGLDSQRNGVEAQAESLAWQVRTAFRAGCAGAFAFAWTDEWYRGGHSIEDWDFGLTTRKREPKPALAAVRNAFAEAPFSPDTAWPRITVVVCSYNGAATIRDTLEGLAMLEYPDFEVIVVDDGSSDETPQIAGEYDVRLISTGNEGLSNARNRGWREASGEIVAYIDDDAWPDPHWLHYIAHAFMTSEHVGIGGPNIAPPGDGPIADCVANAPGGPVHVLVSDTEAEHIPGCNMAFRREALAAIDGFDARYRAAGDDVDICWRLQEQGWTIGYHPAAMDWHHRRNSIRMYWKQQQGYGKAEALLEQKWPEKYNALGHYAWAGRLYGKGLTEALSVRAPRIYQGRWGQALFQSLYEPAPGFASSLPLMPEWFLLAGALAVLAVLGASWPPLLASVPLLVVALAAPVAQAVVSAAKAEFPTRRDSALQRLGLRGLTALLHLIQPVARLKGRLVHGLSPWRARGAQRGFAAIAATRKLWSEIWRDTEVWLEDIVAIGQELGAVVRRGGDFDEWDVELAGGALGATRMKLVIEEHGEGHQLLRLRHAPQVKRLVVAALAVAAALALGAGLAGAWVAAGMLGLAFAALGFAAYRQCAASAASLKRTLAMLEQRHGLVTPA